MLFIWITARRTSFYPRVLEPKIGAELCWEIGRGLGTVYSATVIYSRDEKSYNVALIDPEHIRIGMRVQVPDYGIALAHGNSGVLSTQATVILGSHSDQCAAIKLIF